MAYKEQDQDKTSGCFEAASRLLGHIPDFDIIGYGKVCGCAPTFNFVYVARWHHHRMPKLKMWKICGLFASQE